MSNLFMSLPSFATDYSGFLSIMHGLGGLMVVHDPSGCLGNYTNCDEPRWYHEPQSVFSSIIREIDAVMGDNSGIIEKIKDEIERKRPPFVCIMGTPIPSLTGCDVGAIACEIEQDTGVPCFGIDTDGFKFYNDGIKRAIELLYENFMEKDIDTIKGTVNVIGMNALDYSIYGDKEKLVSLIEECGFKVNSFIGMGYDIDSVKKACSAQKNIIMCASALKTAKKMEKECGIPYFLGPPTGETGAKMLKSFLKGEKTEPVKNNENKCNKSVLIIGEQACANALRTFLYTKEGYERITVASFFGIEKSISQDCDIYLKNEEMLKEIIASKEFDTVIGDPLFERFAKEDTEYICRPHGAVSSKLYWKDIPSQIGKGV